MPKRTIIRETRRLLLFATNPSLTYFFLFIKDGAWLISMESFRPSFCVWSNRVEPGRIKDKTSVEALNYAAAIWLIMTDSMLWVCVAIYFIYTLEKRWQMCEWLSGYSTATFIRSMCVCLSVFYATTTKFRSAASTPKNIRHLDFTFFLFGLKTADIF